MTAAGWDASVDGRVDLTAIRMATTRRRAERSGHRHGGRCANAPAHRIKHSETFVPMRTNYRFGELFLRAHEPMARKVLGEAGLKPSRQRIAICGLLFAGPPRHVTVEDLHAEAHAHGIATSLATVYNTLNQFDEAGLIRRIALPGGRGCYDVNVGNHHHFYVREEDRVFDIDDAELVANLPEPPEGYEIEKVDVVVHLRRKAD